MECPIQLEAVVTAQHGIMDDDPQVAGLISAFEVRITRVHVHPSLVMEGHKYCSLRILREIGLRRTDQMFNCLEMRSAKRLWQNSWGRDPRATVGFSLTVRSFGTLRFGSKSAVLPVFKVGTAHFVYPR